MSHADPLVLRLYEIWKQIVKRCCRPDRPEYKNYGGRGIAVCAEWKAFPRFRADIEKTIGLYGRPMTIDRIDNNRGYEPRNVRWATVSEQARNRRAADGSRGGSTRNIDFRGRTQCVKAWSEEFGVTYDTFYRQLRRLGWSLDAWVLKYRDLAALALGKGE